MIGTPTAATAERTELERAIAVTVTPCQAAPELWFSDAPTERRTAAAWCSDCPALAPCRDYALAAGERFGVWGGLTKEEREELLTTEVTK